LSRGRPLTVGKTKASTPAGRLGPPGQEFVKEVEAEVNFADTGVGLRLLDHEPLVVQVDRPPAQLAGLAHPESGFRHHGDHRATADPVIAARDPIQLRRGGEDLAELVGLKEPSRRPRGLEPPTRATRRVAREQFVLDGSVEDVRQEHERLVDRFVAERDAALSALVAYRHPRLSEGPNPFALDDLLVAVLVDERDGDVRHTEVGEEGQQMVAQAPLVVCLRCRAELGLPRRPPARRKHVERLVSVADRLRARRPPDPDLDLGERIRGSATPLPRRGLVSNVSVVSAKSR
jgi:hypothetical protein